MITIIGAGIAGLSAAIAFRNAGYETIILEASPSLLPIGTGIGLAPNAIKSLKVLGLDNEIVSAGRKLPYFQITDRCGKIISRNDSYAISEKYGIDNLAIHRHKLHELLLSKLKPGSVIMGKKAIDIRTVNAKSTITFADNSTHKADYVVIADGINSTLRAKIAPHATERFAGYTCWRGIVDDLKQDIEGASEIWDRKGRFGIVPLPDKALYWYCCINADEGDTLLKNFTNHDLKLHFKNFQPTVVDILDRATDSFIQNDIYDVTPLERYAYNSVLLIGDAAHGATPNMGQGACQALEDAATLYYQLRQNLNLRSAFLSFERKRISRTHYIINQSRRIGSLAQISNPMLARLRDFALRISPKSLKEKQFDTLYNISLE